MVGRALPVILAVIALGAPACGAVAPADTPVCDASALSIGIVSSGAAAGTAGGYLGFTNRGRTACRLSGWPTVVAVTASGQTASAIPVPTTMLGPRTTGAPVVMLEPGALAEAAFTGNDNPGPGATSCPPPYQRLRVTPPGSQQPAVVSAWLAGLGAYLPACEPIRVSPVVRPSDMAGR